jgi:streptomycin 6-kinase
LLLDDELVTGETLRCKFIDPDGLFGEKACDLAVPMRDWSDELLAGDTLRLCQVRCELLAHLTGVAERAIWQWGYIERVSTGLALLEIGMKSEGAQMLAVAERISRE